MGVTTTLERRRTTGEGQTRLRKASCRAGRVANLVKATPEARVLLIRRRTPGPVGQHDQGHVPVGQAGSQGRDSSGVGVPEGTCPTTLCQIRKIRNPMIEVPVNTVGATLIALRDDPGLADRAQDSWIVIWEALRRTQSPWQKVTGPLSALAATLLEMGWTAQSPTDLRDAAGKSWAITQLTPLQPVLGAVRAAFAAAEARAASQRHDGEGGE